VTAFGEAADYSKGLTQRSIDVSTGLDSVLLRLL
jgi:hypothetical protein